MDPWERIENPEINPCAYSQLILMKEASIYNREKTAFLESWTVTCKSVMLEHTLKPYTKIKSKCLKDLNIRHDTIKLLEKNIGKTFSDINDSNIFLDQFPKTKK